jgi:uncharacterized protein (DUF1810 family)
MPDNFDLSRFVTAQEPLMPRVLEELRAGQKRSHWMWFVFPQIAGLGHSPMARHYAVGSLYEAQAYLAHPVLGPRLVDCTKAVNAVEGRSVHTIFGSPDDMKFRSSMTLFARAEPGQKVFRTALERYCDGAEDPRTVALL